MRSDPSTYDLIAPATLPEVLTTLRDEQRTPIAGGTELMVALCAGRLQPKRFVSIANLPELRFLDESNPAQLRIGANTTFTDLRRCTVIANDFPLLTQTASWTGSVANQNRATLGGNIANASPAADNPPALLVYDATLELISTAGTRTVSYRDFHRGYKQTALLPGELILAVCLPRRFVHHIHFVRKVGTRNAQAISKIALAATALMQNGRFTEIRLAAASLLDHPARLPETEAVFLGQSPADPAPLQQAQATLTAEVAPIDDIRSTARYRTAVANNLLAEFLQQCKDQPIVPG